MRLVYVPLNKFEWNLDKKSMLFRTSKIRTDRTIFGLGEVNVRQSPRGTLVSLGAPNPWKPTKIKLLVLFHVLCTGLMLQLLFSNDLSCIWELLSTRGRRGDAYTRREDDEIGTFLDVTSVGYDQIYYKALLWWGLGWCGGEVWP